MVPLPSSRTSRLPAAWLLTPLAVLASYALSQGRPVGATTGFALLLLVGLSVLASRRPTTALGASLVGIVLLPVYAGPYLGGSLLGATPTLVAALILFPAAALRVDRLRLVPLDWAVITYCTLRVASYVLNFDSGPGAAAGVLLYIALPYGVFRVLTLAPGAATVLARSAVGGGVVVAALAVSERRGMANPWFDLPLGGYQAAQFARPELRLGSVRAEASFGHPLALGMFLAVTIVLAVALALGSRRVASRSGLLLAAGLMLVGLVDTLTRGPLLVLGLAGLLWFALEVRRLSVPRTLALVLLGAAVLSVGSTAATLQQLTQSSQGDTAETRSAAYRLVILDVVRDPAQFSLLGRPTSSGEQGVTDTVSDRTGLKSFDNAFALIYLANGALTLLAFVMVGVLALPMARAPDLNPVERAWVVGLVAAFANLVTVNLLTQFEDVFWLAAALTASLAQRRQSTRTVSTEPVAAPVPA